MEELNSEKIKKEKIKKKKKKNDSGGLVDNSKGAQVMFKTALRNHIDLTNIADNKANIILTINAIIITIALPLLSTYASENHHLYVPAFFLLSTNMASIVYGALVTRPGRMQGKTDLTKIKQGKSNLFFFGNFYKMNIEDYKLEAERAEREGDYGKVAEIRYGKIKEAQERLDVLQLQLAENQAGNSLIKEEVTHDDIAEVVAKWTGIPVTKMLQSEREKLLQLEDELHRRVVGQEEAIIAVSDAVRRSRENPLIIPF